MNLPIVGVFELKTMNCENVKWILKIMNFIELKISDT